MVILRSCLSASRHQGGCAARSVLCNKHRIGRGEVGRGLEFCRYCKLGTAIQLDFSAETLSVSELQPRIVADKGGRTVKSSLPGRQLKMSRSETACGAKVIWTVRGGKSKQTLPRYPLKQNEDPRQHSSPTIPFPTTSFFHGWPSPTYLSALTRLGSPLRSLRRPTPRHPISGTPGQAFRFHGLPFARVRRSRPII